MTDAVDRMIALKERIEKRLSEISGLEEKLETEVAKMEMELALASALAALKAASTDCRHERVRSQINGAREMIQKVIAA
jgi:hypothetical protein